MAIHATKKRSLTKAITYRVICTTETALVSFIVIKMCGIKSAGQIAATISGVLLFTKILTYYVHERLWDHLGWGKES